MTWALPLFFSLPSKIFDRIWDILVLCLQTFFWYKGREASMLLGFYLETGPK